jgi:hypothetical protein
MKKPEKPSPESELLKAFEAAGLIEYLEYIKSGKRVMMTNFKVGIARGLGLTLGMSIVLGIVAWVLALLVDLPVVGEYAKEVESYMTELRESTDYTDEFDEMNALLRSIEENTQDESAEVDVAAGAAAANEPVEISQAAATDPLDPQQPH